MKGGDKIPFPKNYLPYSTESDVTTFNYKEDKYTIYIARRYTYLFKNDNKQDVKQVLTTPYIIDVVNEIKRNRFIYDIVKQELLENIIKRFYDKQLQNSLEKYNKNKKEGK